MEVQKRCRLTAAADSNTQKRFSQMAFFEAVEGGVFFKRESERGEVREKRAAAPSLPSGSPSPSLCGLSNGSGLRPLFKLMSQKLPPTSSDSRSDSVARNSTHVVSAELKGNRGSATLTAPTWNMQVSAIHGRPAQSWLTGMPDRFTVSWSKHQVCWILCPATVMYGTKSGT